jgi:uncharacterized delta-60 repeat protein
MGPRIYPSQQDTNLTAKGSLILTTNGPLEYNLIYVNGIIVNIEYSEVTGLYTIPVNLNDVVDIILLTPNLPNYHSRVVVSRRDYTTDDVNGDYGIVDTYIGESIATSGSTSYTFTATTISNSYNFEYRVESYVDVCFPAGTGFNATVYDCEIQPDNKVLCAGSFTQTVSGLSYNYICRLNFDGSLDTSFRYTGPAFSNIVGEIKLLPDGTILVRTGFRLFKIKSDGSIDAGFFEGIFNFSRASEEEQIVILPDGKIFFVGAFTSYTSAGQTTTKRGIIRLNPNGTIDNTFNEFGSGFTNTIGITDVRGICVQPDGKILLAGEGYNFYNGTTLNRPGLIRLNPDGTLDTSFILNTSTNVVGIEVDIYSNGKILFYNDFGGFNGDPNRKLVRLNSDGSLDNTFPNTAFTQGSTTRIFDILIDNLDRTYVAGLRLTYSGVSIPSLFRLTPTGTNDSTFSDGGGFLNAIPISTGTPYDIELTNSGCLYAVGDFDIYFNNPFISINIVKIRNNGQPFLCQ